MFSHTLYEKYKKDTQDFSYWLANEYMTLFVSNQKNPGPTPQAPQTPQFDFRHPPRVNDFVPLARYIASQSQPVPYHVFSALASAINKRNIATASYTAQVGAPVSPNQAASDASHQHFTNVLAQCRSILGGDGWVSDSIRDNNEPSIERVQEELSSRFKALYIQDAESSSEEEEKASSSRPRQQRRPGKGKGKKKGKLNKGKSKQPAKEQVYEVISMESLRNIDGQDAMTINYLIAVHSAAQQWIELRYCIQRQWEYVAYGDVNAAVAAATSKVAVSMVQRTNAAIFTDFAGNDSYLSIVNALTRGDIDNAQGTFIVEISNEKDRGVRARTISDVKEQFLYNTYMALKDFLHDFRLNRTGRPTNRLRRTLAAWDPTVTLADLNPNERMAWRRVYIIKWLYDLVNVSSAAQLKKNRESSDPKSLEYVDWAGNNERTLFGLNEFAVDITRMAMQKSTFQVETLIQLHHVFQLQCIVDSFTTSRGWFIPMEESTHVLSQPADFQATRDIDLFLDRHGQLVSGGYCASVINMEETLVASCEDVPQLRHLLDQILISGEDFYKYLGQHVYAKNEKRDIWEGIEPSLFGAADANGLHKYSPYLCGAGLEEALSLSYKQMMWLWQMMREPILILHVYKFLKQRNYFDEPIPLWEALAVLFKRGVFRDHQNDTTNSGQALRALLDMRQRLSLTEGENMHKTFDITTCHNFNRHSALSAYRKANWDSSQVILDQSSDEDLSVLLAMLQRGDGGDEEMAITGSTGNTVGAVEMSTTETTAQATGDDGALPTPGPTNPPQPGRDPEKEDRDQDVLSWANGEFLDDICGFNLAKPLRPLSSINYASITDVILDFFNEIEERLRVARNRMYGVYRDRNHPEYHQGRRATIIHERGTMFLHALDLYRTPEQETRQPMDPAARQLLQTTADVLMVQQQRIWEFTYWNSLTRAEDARLEALENAQRRT